MLSSAIGLYDLMLDLSTLAREREEKMSFAIQLENVLQPESSKSDGVEPVFIFKKSDTRDVTERRSNDQEGDSVVA